MYIYIYTVHILPFIYIYIYIYIYTLRDFAQDRAQIPRRSPEIPDFVKYHAKDYCNIINHKRIVNICNNYILLVGIGTTILIITNTDFVKYHAQDQTYYMARANVGHLLSTFPLYEITNNYY